jgi:hypothetical protein
MLRAIAFAGVLCCTPLVSADAAVVTFTGLPSHETFLHEWAENGVTVAPHHGFLGGGDAAHLDSN